MPTGNKLRKDVATKLNMAFDPKTRERLGDPHIWAILDASPANSEPPIMNAAMQISRNVHLVDSIDDYVEIHQGNSQIRYCAKLAIAKSIAEAEEKSRFTHELVDEKLPWENFDETWFVRLLRLMKTAVNRSNIDQLASNVSFITFNYDRTLEHFFVTAIKDLYSISDGEAADIVRLIPILHPYGTIGTLPSLRVGDSNSTMPFGARLRGDALQGAAARIRTYSETIDDPDLRAELLNLVANAEVIVFLGFAFHPQNVDLLTVDTSAVTNIVGTAHGISDAAVRTIKNKRLLHMLGNRQSRPSIRLLNQQCSAFLNENGTTLMGQ